MSYRAPRPPTGIDMHHATLSCMHGQSDDANFTRSVIFTPPACSVFFLSSKELSLRPTDALSV